MTPTEDQVRDAIAHHTKGVFDFARFMANDGMKCDDLSTALTEMTNLVEVCSSPAYIGKTYGHSVKVISQLLDKKVISADLLEMGFINAGLVRDYDQRA